jgi:hypothetical protein
VDIRTIDSNTHFFTRTPAEAAAQTIVDQLEQLQEALGGAPEPLSIQGLAYDLYRSARGGTLTSAVELADLAAATGPQAESARRALDAVAAAVQLARTDLERAVKAGTAEHIEQLNAAWSGLLSEVRALGDVPTTAEQAIASKRVPDFETLQALVARADRIRRHHRDLLGALRPEDNAFLDCETAPDAGELRNVNQRALIPAGPSQPAARLVWLSRPEARSALIPSTKAAHTRFEAWHRSLTTFTMDDRPPVSGVKLR